MKTNKARQKRIEKALRLSKVNTRQKVENVIQSRTGRLYVQIVRG